MQIETNSGMKTNAPPVLSDLFIKTTFMKNNYLAKFKIYPVNHTVFISAYQKNNKNIKSISNYHYIWK